MPTIVGILTFISRINTASESFNARKIFIFQPFYEQLNFHAQNFDLSMIFFIPSGPESYLSFFQENLCSMYLLEASGDIISVTEFHNFIVLSNSSIFTV